MSIKQKIEAITIICFTARDEVGKNCCRISGALPYNAQQNKINGSNLNQLTLHTQNREIFAFQKERATLHHKAFSTARTDVMSTLENENGSGTNKLNCLKLNCGTYASRTIQL